MRGCFAVAAGVDTDSGGRRNAWCFREFSASTHLRCIATWGYSDHDFGESLSWQLSRVVECAVGAANPAAKSADVMVVDTCR